ncbi:MAG: SMP-30/gluconolactonase/LRE family protein, partial [Planctomycetota bacterium]|nr:SMP-30/gluconolactonase/LRE family protein [Planctomycetota bacterium]
TFASKGRCDVAVAIEDGRGRIVRHIVYGVLGSNAPAPLKPDSLEQTLIWDGKDDRGRYVDEPNKCVARVSLGLNPTFDKALAWHPKDTTSSRSIAGIAADKDAVYVLETTGGSRTFLRAFDHHGNYLRTLIPFAGDKFDAGQVDIRKRPTEDGRIVPYLCGLGGIEPTSNVYSPLSLAVAAGRIAISSAGYPFPRTILRLRTDGTTGGEPMAGPIFAKRHMERMAIALSPDGKRIYACGPNFGVPLDGGGVFPSFPYLWNTVWRFDWDFKGVVTESMGPFVGEIGRDRKAGDGSGNDERHLNRPEGTCVDASENVYVCDTGNNRIQVFSPEGKLRESIPFGCPRTISVNHRTGDIFVTTASREKEWLPFDVKIVKIGADRKPKAVVVEKVYARGGVLPIVCADGWAEPPRVWFVAQPGTICVYADKGDKLELVEDFDESVRRDGLRPHLLGGDRMNRIAVDPVRGHLYYLRNLGNLMRCDPEGPGRMETFKPLGGGFPEEIFCGLDGLFYAKALTFIARLDPDRIVPNAQEPRHGEEKADLEFGPDAEVPFDYGEEGRPEWGRTFRGVIKIRSMPGANSYDNGFCVSPRGDVLSFMKNYQSAEAFLSAGRKYESWHLGDGGVEGFMKSIAGRYRPKIFPGRYFGAGELVFRWDARGEPTGEDLIPALPLASFGIRSDAAGNIYVGIGARQVMPKGLHTGGAVAKFPPTGGKFYGIGDIVKLDEKPDRPPDFGTSDSPNLWPPVGGTLYWTKNMYWSYPGLDQIYWSCIAGYPCLCANARFDTDLYGRTFVPKAYAFTVGVVDTNGNPICDIGRYGNADARGPEICVAHCSFVATHSDRWLYLNDDGNNRIIRVRLGYRAEERAGLQAKEGADR